MHRLREEQNERGLRPWSERLALKAWAWMAGKPLLYRWFARRAARYLNWLADGSGRIRIFGLAPEWTQDAICRYPPAGHFTNFTQQERKPEHGIRS